MRQQAAFFFLLPVIGAAQPADFVALARSTRALLQSSAAPAEAKVEAAKLLAQANELQQSAKSGEARRAVAHAAALARNEPWNAASEFAASLALRPERIVADSSRPILIRITQHFPAPSPGPLRIHATLGPASADFTLPARDLIDQPFAFELFPAAAEDGEHLLTVQLHQPATRLEHAMHLILSLDARQAAVELRLSKAKARESSAASARYPFDLARLVNLGIRRLNTNDFGLNDAGTMSYNFSASIRAAESLAQTLASGKDPLHRANGDHERHYWFADAGEFMPYRVYAPSKWDGKSKLPMLLVLHGNSRDHNYYFDRDNGILAKLAEQHGFLVACPLGYRPNAGYNALSPRMRQTASPDRIRQGELSEKDARNVLELVAAEFGADRSRIFLFGHSAGGAGTWHIAAKSPDLFAGIAISAAATRAEGYPFENLRGLPIMLFHGANDTEVPIALTRDMREGLLKNNIEHIYEEVPAATHGTIVALVEPKIFDRFKALPPRKK